MKLVKSSVRKILGYCHYYVKRQRWPLWSQHFQDDDSCLSHKYAMLTLPFTSQYFHSVNSRHLLSAGRKRLSSPWLLLWLMWRIIIEGYSFTKETNACLYGLLKIIMFHLVEENEMIKYQFAAFKGNIDNIQI